MPSLNQITIMGHAGRDAEWKDVGSGLCSFSLAVSKSWKNKSGEWEKSTEWFTIKSWGEWGKKHVGKILKGHLVYVSGEVSLARWTGKDQTEMSGMEITANARDIILLTKVEPTGATVEHGDGLPF